METRPLINFVMLRREFDFRGIEMGRWVTEAERDKAAVNFHQALQDLMQVLGAPHSLISLRGSLGIQYGKGGRPGVAAHYMPATRQLALAKNAGAGSLAHEWFHAFDHYMGAKMFATLASDEFASFGWINSAVMHPHPLNDSLAACFKAIMLSPDGQSPSELFQHSTQADRTHKILYYAKPEELAARAFEAFVEDCAPHSHFLVRGTRYSSEAKSGLYPQGADRERINQAFKHYFHTLGQALFRELD